MVGESQRTPNGKPDPSVLTTEQMLLAVENLEKQTEGLVAGEVNIIKERIASLLREVVIREEHRLELKADSEKALATAREADQKAVAAALAAAEKARDQETIRTQLATDKTEKSFKEALAQSNETFTVAIQNIVSGLNEVKGLVASIMAEKRGNSERTSSIYAAVGFLGTVLIIFTVLVANGVLSR